MRKTQAIEYLKAKKFLRKIQSWRWLTGDLEENINFQKRARKNCQNCVNSHLDAIHLPSVLWTDYWSLLQPKLSQLVHHRFCIHFYFHSNLIFHLRLTRSSSLLTFSISTISSFRARRDFLVYFLPFLLHALRGESVWCVFVSELFTLYCTETKNYFFVFFSLLFLFHSLEERKSLMAHFHNIFIPFYFIVFGILFIICPTQFFTTFCHFSLMIFYFQNYIKILQWKFIFKFSFLFANTRHDLQLPRSDHLQLRNEENFPPLSIFWVNSKWEQSLRESEK